MKRIATLSVSVLILLAVEVGEATAGFVNNIDMFGDYTQYLYSTKNAAVVTESDGVTRYWAPTGTGVQAEVIFHYTLGFEIGQASLYGVILAISPDAHAYLDVSRDGVNYTTIESGYQQTPPPVDVSSILMGSSEVYVRARLSTDSSPGIYSQFLRTAPYLHAPDVYQFEAAPVAVPEPASIVSLVIGVGCIMGFTWRRRAYARPTV